MLPFVVITMLRGNTERMAAGHNANFTPVAVLLGPVRGREAVGTQSRGPVRVESAAVTSAPYTVRPATMRPRSGWGRAGHLAPWRHEGSGGAVGIGPGQLAAVQIAGQRWDRAARVDTGAGTDALPHHALACRARVDDRGRGRGDPFGAHDRVVLHTEQQDIDLEVLGRLW